MKVLFASVEMYPLAKVGGLGDVAGSLPAALRKRDVDIRVIMPYHGSIKVDAEEIASKTFEFGEVEFYKTEVDKVPVYLVKSDAISREKVYGDEDWLRWSLFSRVVAESSDIIDFEPEIIHCNDWMTSLIPLYSKIMGYKRKFVLTIHNLKHQGSFEEEKYGKLGIGEEWKDILMWRGKLNYMKAGITLADRVTTVSPTYAKEILTEEYGEGLAPVLRANSSKLVGILNGLDYSVWNPEQDKNILVNYSIENIEKKKENKKIFCEELGLDPSLPLFGMVARLVEQKGVDILIDAIRSIKNANFVILGTGREKFEEALKKLTKERNIRAIIKYDEVNAHRIYAASDFFLMPSKFEPCGLGQLIAMRYGTIPVVRKTGGLADTVVDINDGGWGIVFEEYSSESLRAAITRGVELYSMVNLKNIRKVAMKQDFSWGASAKKYEELYSNILQ